MDLDLKEFGLTLAVGLAMIGIVHRSLYVTYRNYARRFASFFQMEQKVRLVLVGTVAVLAVGIICEDISKEDLAEGSDDVAFSPQLRDLLESEGCSRYRLLFKEVKGAAVTVQDVCSDEGHHVAPTALGNQLMDTLNNLASHQQATQQEVLVKDQLDECMQRKSCDLNLFTATTHRLYYIAKNTALQNPAFQRDLEQFRARFDFERTLCFVLLTGIYLLSFLYIVVSTQAMYRDVGGMKFLASGLLLLVAIAALLDILVPPSALSQMWDWSEISTVAANDSKAPGVVSKSWRVAQNWLLPAATIFIAMYRTRRIGKRLAGNWKIIARSTFDGEPLIQHEREHKAAAVLMMLLMCTGLIIPVRFAYISDEEAYLKRVFGYYQTLRDAPLHCGPSPGNCVVPSSNFHLSNHE